MGWPGPVTHRQHEAFLAWLAMQAERMGHKPKAAEPEPEEMTVEQAAAVSKARWRGRKLRAQQQHGH